MVYHDLNRFGQKLIAKAEREVPKRDRRRARCCCYQPSMPKVTETGLGTCGIAPSGTAEACVHATGVSTCESRCCRSADTSAVHSRPCSEQTRTWTAAALIFRSRSAEPARPCPRQDVTDDDSGTENTIAADSQIFGQLNTGCRDKRALSSLPHISCMELPYEK